MYNLGKKVGLLGCFGFLFVISFFGIAFGQVTGNGGNTNVYGNGVPCNNAVVGNKGAGSGVIGNGPCVSPSPTPTATATPSATPLPLLSAQPAPSPATGSATTLTCTFGATPAPNTAVIIEAGYYGPAPASTPAGFTSVASYAGGANSLSVYGKIAGSSEPLSYSVTWSTSFSPKTVKCQNWLNVDPTVAVSAWLTATPIHYSSAGTTFTTPSITSTSPYDFLAYFGANQVTSVSSVGSGWTEIGFQGYALGAGYTLEEQLLNTQVTGAETATVTWGQSTTGGNAAIIGLPPTTPTPAPTAPPTPNPVQFVQASKTVGSGNGLTLKPTFSGTPTTNDAMVCGVVAYPQTYSPSTIPSNLVLLESNASTTTGENLLIYGGFIGASPPTEYDFVFTAPGHTIYAAAVCGEYTNVDTTSGASTWVKSQTTVTTSSTISNLASLTGTATNSLPVGFFAQTASSIAVTDASGWVTPTNGYATGANGLDMQYKLSQDAAAFLENTGSATWSSALVSNNAAVMLPDTTATPAPSPTPAPTIILSATTGTVNVSSTVTFTATKAHDTTTMTSSTANSSIATVSPSSVAGPGPNTFTVTGVGAGGPINIQISDGTATANYAVTVTTAPTPAPTPSWVPNGAHGGPMTTLLTSGTFSQGMVTNNWPINTNGKSYYLFQEPYNPTAGGVGVNQLDSNSYPAYWTFPYIISYDWNTGTISSPYQVDNTTFSNMSYRWNGGHAFWTLLGFESGYVFLMGNSIDPYNIQYLSNNLPTPTYTTVAGGSLTSGVTRYYRITGVTNQGESMPTASVAVTPSGSNLSVKIAPNGANNAAFVFYNIYEGATAGSEKLLTTIGNLSTGSFTDTGAITPSGALPTQDTTHSDAIPYGSSSGVPGTSYFAQPFKIAGPGCNTAGIGPDTADGLNTSTNLYPLPSVGFDAVAAAYDPVKDTIVFSGQGQLSLTAPVGSGVFLSMVHDTGCAFHFLGQPNGSTATSDNPFAANAGASMYNGLFDLSPAPRVDTWAETLIHTVTSSTSYSLTFTSTTSGGQFPAGSCTASGTGSTDAAIAASIVSTLNSCFASAPYGTNASGHTKFTAIVPTATQYHSSSGTHIVFTEGFDGNTQGYVSGRASVSCTTITCDALTNVGSDDYQFPAPFNVGSGQILWLIDSDHDPHNPFNTGYTGYMQAMVCLLMSTTPDSLNRYTFTDCAGNNSFTLGANSDTSYTGQTWRFGTGDQYLSGNTYMLQNPSSPPSWYEPLLLSPHSVLSDYTHTGHCAPIYGGSGDRDANGDIWIGAGTCETNYHNFRSEVFKVNHSGLTTVVSTPDSKTFTASNQSTVRPTTSVIVDKSGYVNIFVYYGAASQWGTEGCSGAGGCLVWYYTMPSSGQTSVTWTRYATYNLGSAQGGNFNIIAPADRSHAFGGGHIGGTSVYAFDKPLPHT